MCGIAGIIDFRGRAIDETVLRRMGAALAHRGPDDSGVWTHHAPGFCAGLAHTRLAVIDPTPEAHQPMIDAGGSRAVAYNGELYNYRSLRGQLPVAPRTASDTEVVLGACSAWGPDALRRFDGMWALAYVDAADRVGHLSRDPFGIKPLYYAEHDGRLVFASEMRALACVPDLPREIDPDAVSACLNLGYIPHPQTIYHGVHKLPPGHVLRFAARGLAEPERYYHLAPRQATTSPLTFDAAASRLREVIAAAVLRQKVSDVPLGAFLSGGLDSSVVVACLAREADVPVKTFSIGYANQPRYDETQYAEMVARHFGTEHRSFRLTFKDVLDTIEPMLGHLGEPFADSSLLPTSLVSRYTRGHVTVALSGDGGDELFGGYWRYLGHHYLQRYHRLPRALRKGVIEPLLRWLPSARSSRRLDRLRQARKLLRGNADDPMDRHLAWACHLGGGLAAELLGDERARASADSLLRLYRDAPDDLCSADVPSLSALERILLADLAVGLPADMLHKVDLASMYHSLEVRVPLLSADVVEFVTALPIDYRIRDASGKRILRAAFHDMLPEAVLRRSKMGFEVPIGEFLRNELREMYADVVTPAALRDFGLDPAVAEKLYREHAVRREDHSEILWSLFVLCCWKQGRCH